MEYFHGTIFNMPIGFELTPQPNGYANNPATSKLEDLFEECRPANKTPRAKAVYISDDMDLIDAAGGYTDVIYVVEPVGEPEKSDLAWYTEADNHLQEGNYFDAMICASNYWSGKEYIHPEKSCFEFRCVRAKVLSVSEINVDVCDLEPVKPQESLVKTISKRTAKPSM